MSDSYDSLRFDVSKEFILIPEEFADDIQAEIDKTIIDGLKVLLESCTTRIDHDENKTSIVEE
jgi:hypothetical protein